MRNVRTEKAPVPVGPYSQAIIVDKMVFCSGQIGIDPLTGKLVSTGTADEARQSIENVHAVLAAAGSSMGKVVKVTIFMTDLDLFKEARLPLGATIEIEVVASL